MYSHCRTVLLRETLDLFIVILRNPLPAGLERWQQDLAEEKEGNMTVI